MIICCVVFITESNRWEYNTCYVILKSYTQTEGAFRNRVQRKQWYLWGVNISKG